MLTLYINGKQADIKDESIIAVTKTYENVSNPLNYYADYSKTIKLPISPRNNDIFNNFNRLDNIVTDTTIDPRTKIPFILLNNQEPVMEGYMKLENTNTIWTDEAYEVTLFSTFGLLMNDLKLLTFNPNAQDIDEKYIIDSPFSDDLLIDRNLVKQSFEQNTHSINGNSVLDWIGFIATYQGKYADFSSNMEQILPSGRTEDRSRERDEHYTREFRSYYQQPFIWVDKLWKVAKDKIDEITDYTMVLDPSWFIPSNPYYQDLIYTCPNLYNSGTTTFIEENQVFSPKTNEVELHQYARSSRNRLDTHRTLWLDDLTSGSGDIYNENGVFNANADKGSTVFKGSFNFTLFAYSTTVNGLYAKITDDSPFYVKFKAVNAVTNQPIFGASKTFLIYSDDNDAPASSYDEAVDVSISERGDMPSNMSSHSPQYSASDGFAWNHTLSVELNVMENVPYKVGVEIWCLNNEKPFEWVNSNPTLTPTWDWLWTDFFVEGDGKGYSMWFDTMSASVATTENMRTNSTVSLYKIFPKETTLCDVLLNYSKMFGLVWKIDEQEKTVTVMTRDRFFENYHIEDWSAKIDRNKEFKFNPLTFDKRYVEFNFDKGDCHRLKRYDDFYQLTYGTKKLDSGYEFNADTNKLFDRLTPSVIAQKRQFSKMMNTQFEDRPNFMGYSYMVYPNEHFVDNDSNGENAGMSGAFYFKNGTFTPDPQLSNWDSQGNYVFAVTDDTEHMIKTQEYCWNSCGENVSLCYKFPDISTISNRYGDYNFSVHFEVPKEYYFDKSGIGEVKYIYDTFWRDYINERYCSQNKKLTAYVYLTVDEFQKLDFTEFVVIDNILYHIDKIYDFNFNSDAPVKIDFAQVWNLNAYLGSGSPFPYLYTDYREYSITGNSSITIPVHASGEWSASVFGRENWIQATRSGDNLVLQTTNAPDEMRQATIMLNLNGTIIYWSIKVTNVKNIRRLNVTPETLVFNELGGTQEVLIDASNMSNSAITVTTSKTWLSAVITDYFSFVSASVPETARRSYLHLEVTASPCTRPISRNATVNLNMDWQGTAYTAVVHVGQQGGTLHRMDDENRVITDIEDFEIYDSQNNRVTSLTAGEEYTFEDFFPEEIDINSIEITNGTVSISGNSGLQTVTFTPQLSDGNEVGGGVITATTLNGNRISYPYNVSMVPEPPSPPEPPTSDTYFYVEDISGSSNTVSIVKDHTDAPDIEVFYSTDQTNWTSMGTTSTTAITATVPANGRLYLKATATQWGAVTSGYKRNSITASGRHNVGGNIMSLLYGDNFQNQTTFPSGSRYTFRYLFIYNSTLVSAENLVLPATTLVYNCYQSMFTYCTSLTKAPATLPATTLAEGCYSGMFYDCTSLTQAPATLPATSLAKSCYAIMFIGCTSLTMVPVLPATTLVNFCYINMFNGCTNLTKVITYADDISAYSCTENWLRDVAPQGGLYNYGSATFTIDSPSGIPVGWTEHTGDTAPDKRRVTVKSDSSIGLFRIYTDGLDAKTTDYIVMNFNDGTEVKLTAVPNKGFTFDYWKDGQGNIYNTITLTFTVSGSLLDEDGGILFTPIFKESDELVTVTFNAGEYGGLTTPPYLTIGSDSTHYTTVTKVVPRGSVIGNVQAHGTDKAFRQWSDGATANPRDYIANSNATITALYTTATAIDITADGSGLYGADDVINIYINGDKKITVQKDMVNSIPLSDGTYTVKAECLIRDINSKFNSFKIGNNYYYSNPYTLSTNSSTTVGVVTIPSGLYYAEENLVDAIENDDQSPLIGGQFNREALENHVKIETNHAAEMTIALPLDYTIKEIIDSDGYDVMEEKFTITKSNNGNWWILYTDRSNESDNYLFRLELA